MFPHCNKLVFFVMMLQGIVAKENACVTCRGASTKEEHESDEMSLLQNLVRKSDPTSEEPNKNDDDDEARREGDDSMAFYEEATNIVLGKGDLKKFCKMEKQTQSANKKAFSTCKDMGDKELVVQGWTGKKFEKYADSHTLTAEHCENYCNGNDNCFASIYNEKGVSSKGGKNKLPCKFLIGFPKGGDVSACLAGAALNGKKEAVVVKRECTPSLKTVAGAVSDKDALSKITEAMNTLKDSSGNVASGEKGALKKFGVDSIKFADGKLVVNIQGNSAEAIGKAFKQDNNKSADKAITAALKTYLNTKFSEVKAGSMVAKVDFAGVKKDFSGK